ncbi:uncharacterized protein LOC111072235 [Drosophila obscura]|uniref:uncharacterized protein LOC111072235 n=1 Tax=Drosophila obscura TaxID=7282 RepID=UPI001BB17ED0|nr:uncharacterized protein LOC111072235 [Drosophila obscura]
MSVCVPSPDAHWTLKFRDFRKPFPASKVANATFKVIRFLYPPFALGGTDIIPVVDDPQLDFALIFLIFWIALILGRLSYAAYRIMFLVQHSPASKVRSKRQRGFWDRYGTDDPLLDPCMAVHTNSTSILPLLDLHCHQAEEKKERVGNVWVEQQPVASPRVVPSGKYTKSITCQFLEIEEKTEIDLTELIERIDETVQQRKTKKTRRSKNWPQIKSVITFGK